MPLRVGLVVVSPDHLVALQIIKTDVFVSFHMDHASLDVGVHGHHHEPSTLVNVEDDDLAFTDTFLEQLQTS